MQFLLPYHSTWCCVSLPILSCSRSTSCQRDIRSSVFRLQPNDQVNKETRKNKWALVLAAQDVGTPRWYSLSWRGTESARRLTTRRTASKEQYNVPQQPETVHLWLWICLASYRTAKDALRFLWEQPGQLKFIEWPSFQSTIRMAVLTVVVVALLIVFLTTIDSTFSYVLSSMLRRIP